ncbi:tyrosine-type recombinase/integrase [Niabella beijingensis]|uniref:tyrosine-type recombinase/integrase n=1 Tax=Niabella beijingensis TaxID=2872700 RepID=UPI001CBE7267|nr:site-specific integrase [Niabella beijingensis]MBZ4192623.1 site-specific integrase [Niabella beijingensis]
MNTQEKKIFAPVSVAYETNYSGTLQIGWNNFLPNRNTFLETITDADSKETETVPGTSTESKDDWKTNPLKRAIILNAGEWRLSTRRAYATVADSFSEFLGDLSPAMATTEIVHNFIVWLLEREASKNKLNKYRNELHTLYDKAIGFDLLEDNPVPKVKTKKLKRRSKHYFDDEQIAAFKSIEIQKQVWLGIQLLYYCYIRPKEQRFLKISAIDFGRSTIEIHGEDSKNDRTARVRIPRQLMEQLQFLKDFPSHYYVFGRNKKPGKVQVGHNWLNYEHTKLLKQLNITGNYSVYSWKHTGVVKAVKAGINIKELQLQLRHHSLDMVNEYLKDLGIYDSDELLNAFPTL